jgi:hypothetical protein
MQQHYEVYGYPGLFTRFLKNICPSLLIPCHPMGVYTSSLTTKTTGLCDIHDITFEVEDCLSDSSIQDGIVIIFIPGATAGITTIGFGSGTVCQISQWPSTERSLADQPLLEFELLNI